MGCCCSCCCCKDSIEPSLDYQLSTTDRAKTPSIREDPAGDAHSIPDDQPPPYEQEAQLQESSSTTQPKDLPYIIPCKAALYKLLLLIPSVTSATSPEDSIAAAYAEDLSHWMTKDQYLEFLAGLDRGLFASPIAEPGSASAYIQSMFQDQGWQSSAGAVTRSRDYLQQQNDGFFQPRGLQAEILTTDQMKSRIDAGSQAQLARQESDQNATRAEGKRTREELQLQQRLLTAKTINRQQKAMQKFLEKDDKYSRGLGGRGGRAAESSRAPETSSDGIYWLLISKFSS